MAGLRCEGVDKVYEGGVHAVRGLDLEIADGELLVLLGPSGCGKSTVLRLVAGLEPLTDGRIFIGDRRVDRDPPDRRDVAMVFQGYALYGHMTVRENLEFPLRMRGMDRAERRRRAEEIAGLLELGSLLDARPATLSGGQQQRVAMGRALVRRPAAFLLDEPLSNLDARLRTHVREEIRRLQRRLAVTTVHVTHDQVEALSLGDRIAVLRAGRLQQVGPGQTLYDRPANTFVAAFLGQPGMNLLEGRMERRGGHGDDDGDWRVALAGAEAAVPVAGLGTGRAATALAAGALEGRPVVFGIRPEDLEIAEESPETLAGTVRAVETLGREHIVHVELPVPTLDATSDEGATARGLFAVRIDAREGPPRPGARVHLRPRPAAVRLFDEDGQAPSAR